MADIRLHNVNCMDFMKGVPDKAYDLAIVDPPYGIGASKYARGGTQYGKSAAVCNYYELKDWDSYVPDQSYFNELYRVSSNQIIWGANHLGKFDGSPCWIVWDKMTAPGSGYADCELAYTSFKTAVRKAKIQWSGMLQPDMKNKEVRIHPTQKPVALYKWLLKNYAKPGDRILDTHGGSMSIAIACYDLGFELDLCELDTDYFNAGQKRLDNHISKYAPASQIPATKKGELKLF